MKYIIGGNWKMNGTGEEASVFLAEMKEQGFDSSRTDVIIFPPFTLIHRMAEPASEIGIGLGGQDLFWEMKGAYTGEISPIMLKEAGADWFIAGHSERRHIIGESDEIVRMKLEAGLVSGLSGILCVGELREEREAERTEQVVRSQIEMALEGLDVATPENLVVAYEPVWAIGTGLTATPQEAERMHYLIRQWIADIVSHDFADSIRIQYGGSVKPVNATDILSQPSVNGALVGGASLNAGSFLDIVRSVQSNN